MNASASRGRLEFVGAVGAMTLLLLLLALGVWRRGAEFKPVVQLGRVVMFVGLAVLAYGGAGAALRRQQASLGTGEGAPSRLTGAAISYGC